MLGLPVYELGEGLQNGRTGGWLDQDLCPRPIGIEAVAFGGSGVECKRNAAIRELPGHREYGLAIQPNIENGGRDIDLGGELFRRPQRSCRSDDQRARLREHGLKIERDDGLVFDDENTGASQDRLGHEVVVLMANGRADAGFRRPMAQSLKTRAAASAASRPAEPGSCGRSAAKAPASGFAID